MNVMGAGAVFLMSGVLAAGLQGIWLTSFSSVLLANFLMLWGAGEYYQALRLFDGQETSRWFTFAVAAAVTGVNLFFYAVVPSLSTRVIVMSLAFSFLMGLSGIRILRSRSVSGTSVRNTASGSFWLVSLFFVARVVGTLFFGGIKRPFCTTTSADPPFLRLGSGVRPHQLFLPPALQRPVQPSPGTARASRTPSRSCSTGEPFRPGPPGDRPVRPVR